MGGKKTEINLTESTKIICPGGQAQPFMLCSAIWHYCELAIVVGVFSWGLGAEKNIWFNPHVRVSIIPFTCQGIPLGYGQPCVWIKNVYFRKGRRVRKTVKSPGLLIMTLRHYPNYYVRKLNVLASVILRWVYTHTHSNSDNNEICDCCCECVYVTFKSFYSFINPNTKPN